MTNNKINMDIHLDKDRKFLSGVVRIISYTVIFIHIVFILADWMIDPDLFLPLLLLKVMAVSILFAVVVMTYINFFKNYYEVLVIVVLATLLSSTLLHSALLGEPMFTPLTAVVCVTFSASMIPWTFRWHLLVLFFCISVILFNHWYVNPDQFWPITKTVVLSVFLCMTSLLLMHYSLKNRRELVLATKKIRESEQQALNLAAQLQKLANTDYLTGAGNLRSCHKYVEGFLNNDSEGKNSIFVILMDLDHFKRVNDQYGHAIGDEVLKKFVSLCQECFQVESHLCRIGGEEFAVLLPASGTADSSQNTAIQLSANLLKRVEQHVMHVAENDPEDVLRVTLSIGLSMTTEGEDDIKHAIRRADQALYSAKRTGRNKLVCWSPSLEAIERD